MSRKPRATFAIACRLFLCLGIVIATVGTSTAFASIEPESLQSLVEAADQKDVDQKQARDAWQAIVRGATVEDLPVVLAAMKDAGPLGENWLRAAVDSIAERTLASDKKLPAESLQKFLKDDSQSPRARRIAYEWLDKIEPESTKQMLPTMLDDKSLELRYDAIAALMSEAEAAEDDEAKIKSYQRAFQSARDKSQLKACAAALKELGQSPNMAKQLGFLVNWHVIGPFDNSDRKGFDKVYPPEQSVHLDAEVAARDGQVTWKAVEAEQEDFDKLGIVDLNEELVEEKSVLAYATTTFVSDEAKEVELRWESKEATKLWLNGEQLAAKNVYHSGSDFDQYTVACKFKEGPNRILIKVCQNEQTQPWTKPWDFRLRVTDDLGGAIQPAK